MRIYTVHEPPDAPADRQDRAERLRFVRDGFSWTAVVLGPLWLALRGLWLAVIGYLFAVVFLHFAMTWLGLGQNAATIAIMAVHVLIGLEADTIERWTLARNRWTEIGSVSGNDRLDCERRFLDKWLPMQPVIRSDTLARSSLANLDAQPLAPRPAPWRRGGWRSAFSMRRPS